MENVVIKKFLTSLGLLEFARETNQWLNKEARLDLIDDKRCFDEWAPKLLINGKDSIKQYTKKVLIFTHGNGLTFPYELVVAKAFLESGYTPVIMGARNRYVKRLWRVSGITTIVDFDYFGINHNEVTLQDFDISNFDKVLSFTVDGVRIGKIALSVLLRQTRLGSPDFSKHDIQKKIF